MARDDQTSSRDRIVRRLHLSGWSIGDVEDRGEAGSMWVVWGTDGTERENAIRADGSAQSEGWRRGAGPAPIIRRR